MWEHVFSLHRRSKSKNWRVSVIRGPLNLELVEQFFQVFTIHLSNLFSTKLPVPSETVNAVNVKETDEVTNGLNICCG